MALLRMSSRSSITESHRGLNEVQIAPSAFLQSMMWKPQILRKAMNEEKCIQQPRKESRNGQVLVMKERYC